MSVLLDLWSTEQLYPNCVDNGLMSTQRKTEGVWKKKRLKKRKCNCHHMSKTQTCKRIGIYDFVATLYRYRTKWQNNCSSNSLAKQISYKRTTEERERMPFGKKKKTFIKISRHYMGIVIWIEYQTHKYYIGWGNANDTKNIL